MLKKIRLGLYILSLIMIPVSAHADKEFIQKIQAMVGKVQEQGKAAQEAIQSNLDEIKKLREEVNNVKEMATEDINAVNKALDEAQNLHEDALKEMNKVAKGLDVEDPEERSKAIDNTYYVSKKGEGNDSEEHEKAQEFMQDVMREATTNLYALGFTTRTTMQKEKPRDVDMSSSDKIAREIGFKSGEIMERLSKIYLLESEMQNYQYTQAMKVMTIDNAASEEEEKK